MTGREEFFDQVLPDGRYVVICGRTDDAQAWLELLGSERCLAVALDDVPEACSRTLQGASDQLAWQHDVIASLDGFGWLADLVNSFDPHRDATLVVPDPLDPPSTGRRRRIGVKQPAWRIFEDKSAVEALWDAAGVPRAPSIVADGTANLAELGRLVDHGAGVVCSHQAIGAGPTAGGDGIWWWQNGQLPATMPAAEPGFGRIRLMPLLEGTPARLHGMVLSSSVIPFPPMEIVTLPRLDRGTFLCAGTVPIFGRPGELNVQTENLGLALRRQLGYRGGFSVDGILAADGFLPTDFNARLTSAMEAAPSHLRVQLQLINLLVRDRTEPEPAVVEHLATEIFAAGNTYTLFGAASRADAVGPRTTAVCWDGDSLVPGSTVTSDGLLRLTRSPRGWLLTATLTADRLPGDGRVGPMAPEVFRISDEVLGTDFGRLAPPFDVSRANRARVDSVPAQREQSSTSSAVPRTPGASEDDQAKRS